MACAEDNLQVCNITTPAQYFHVLRRQVRRDFRRPLVIMAPKSLLRHKLAVSPVDALVEGSFKEILDDPRPPAEVRRLVLCSGKLYYDLLAGRGELRADDVALVRVEQFYPFCENRMQRIVELYRGAVEVIWAQEEPQNRGGWTFMQPILERFFRDRLVQYVGRPASASPATGSLKVHRQEQQAIVSEALGKAKGSQ
jgi:2-oxoglutarate dehydrogenase E1 component